MFNLETSRLIIKAHTFDNAEKLLQWDNNKELLYYNDNKPVNSKPVTIEEIHTFINDSSQEKSHSKLIHYAIHKKPILDLIGYGMIAFIDYYNRQCKLGIVIGNKDDWGKGYAKEALKEVINYCFTSLKMNRIGAEVYAINQRSIYLFEHLGFKREGTIRDSVLKDNNFVDEYLYGLLKSEWEKTLSIGYM